MNRTSTFLPAASHMTDDMMGNENYQVQLITSSMMNTVFHSEALTIILILQPCSITFSDITLQCFSGNVMLFNHNQHYEFLPDSTLASDASQAYAIVLHFTQEFVNHTITAELSDCPIFYDLLRLKGKRKEHLFFDCDTGKELMPYMETLLHECNISRQSDNKTIKYAFLLLMSNLHRIHHQHLIISESSMMSDYTIGRILKYMTDNYQSVTLTTLAEEFNFHPSYLSVMFKQLSGFTFSEKLLMIKLEQAKRMLLTTDLSVQAIVEMIGFKEKSYFHKAFKNYYGITPAKYRKEKKTLV